MNWFKKHIEESRQSSSLPEELSWDNMSTSIYDGLVEQKNVKKKKKRRILFFLLFGLSAGLLVTLWSIDRKSNSEEKFNFAIEKVTEKPGSHESEEQNEQVSLQKNVYKDFDDELIYTEKEFGGVNNVETKEANSSREPVGSNLNPLNIKKTNESKGIVEEDLNVARESSRLLNGALPEGIRQPSKDIVGDELIQYQKDSYTLEGGRYNNKSNEEIEEASGYNGTRNKTINQKEYRTVVELEEKKKIRSKYKGTTRLSEPMRYLHHSLPILELMAMHELAKVELEEVNIKYHQEVYVRIHSGTSFLLPNSNFTDGMQELKVDQLPSLQSSIGLNWSVKRNLFVYGDLKWIKSFEKYDYKTSSIETRVLEDQVVALIRNPLTGRVRSVRSNVSIDVMNTRSLRNYNTMNHLSFNLGMGWRKRISRWQFSPDVGISMAKIIAAKGKALVDRELINYNTPQSRYRSGLQFGISSGIRISYQLSNRLNVGINGQFIHYIKPWDQSILTETKTNFLLSGLSIGYRLDE